MRLETSVESRVVTVHICGRNVIPTEPCGDNTAAAADSSWTIVDSCWGRRMTAHDTFQHQVVQYIESSRTLLAQLDLYVGSYHGALSNMHSLFRAYDSLRCGILRSRCRSVGIRHQL